MIISFNVKLWFKDPALAYAASFLRNKLRNYAIRMKNLTLKADYPSGLSSKERTKHSHQNTPGHDIH